MNGQGTELQWETMNGPLCLVHVLYMTTLLVRLSLQQVVPKASSCYHTQTKRDRHCHCSRPGFLLYRTWTMDAQSTAAVVPVQAKLRHSSL